MMKKTNSMEKENNELNKTRKNICQMVVAFAVGVAIIFLVLNELTVSKGILLGACFSIINFLLMGRTLPMLLMQSRAKAGFIGFTSMLSRYVLLAIPMIIAIKSASFSFVAVVVGIFSVQIVTILKYVVFKPMFPAE